MIKVPVTFLKIAAIAPANADALEKGAIAPSRHTSVPPVFHSPAEFIREAPVR
jgi:hypothetical protein